MSRPEAIRAFFVAANCGLSRDGPLCSRGQNVRSITQECHIDPWQACRDNPVLANNRTTGPLSSQNMSTIRCVGSSRMICPLSTSLAQSFGSLAAITLSRVKTSCFGLSLKIAAHIAGSKCWTSDATLCTIKLLVQSTLLKAHSAPQKLQRNSELPWQPCTKKSCAGELPTSRIGKRWRIPKVVVDQRVKGSGPVGYRTNSRFNAGSVLRSRASIFVGG